MEPAEAVQTWIAAWNARDADALVGLADEDIEVDTPRGTGRGIRALHDYVARQSYGVRLFICPQELHVRGDRVVATGAIEFRSVDEGDKVLERNEDVAAAFRLRGDRIARVRPYPDAATALRAQGFAEAESD